MTDNDAIDTVLRAVHEYRQAGAFQSAKPDDTTVREAIRKYGAWERARGAVETLAAAEQDKFPQEGRWMCLAEPDASWWCDRPAALEEAQAALAAAEKAMEA